MYKLVTFAGYDDRFGPHIFPIEPDREKTIGHIKMARALPARIEHYIRTAKSVPGKTQLLIDALGAGEYYGSNSNGDVFYEEALRHEGSDYGYQTFMHYAYPFKHHVNKDPARAYGDKVTLSDYDMGMHRVLLIVHIDDQKCQDILADLAQGRYWDVSMGARVPYDRCSICNNRAKNRGEYCPHLRYQMNRILQDGRRVMAINDKPKFFDISFVTIGAEKASHVLQKVASQRGGAIELSADAGERYYAKLSAATKKAVQKKRAAIDKEVPSQPPANIQGATPEDKAKLESFVQSAGQVKSHEKELPAGVLNGMASFSMPQIFSTLAALGIDLRPQEFQRIVLVKLGAKALADELERRHLVFDEYRPAQTPPSWANSIRFDSGAVSEKVAMLLEPHLAERSCYPEILLARLERMEKRADVDGYKRDSQWYPMTEEEKRLSSGIAGVTKAGPVLAAGFMVFRKLFPGLKDQGPPGVATIAKYPWLLPLLVGAGVGASVGISTVTEPRPLGPYGTGRGLDGMKTASYHDAKTASLAALGLIPLTYIYAGVQQKKQRYGEPVSSLGEVVAEHPGVASLAAFLGGRRLQKELPKLLKKQAGVLGNLALYTIGASKKVMPLTLAGGALDLAIFDAIGRLAAKNKKGTTSNAYTR